MSQLAARSFCIMLHSNALVLEQRQVVSKQKVTDTLVDLLTAGGSRRKQALQLVSGAWDSVLQNQPRPSNPLHQPFVGVLFACRVGQLVGLPTSPEDVLPGLSGVIEVDGAEMGHQMVAVDAAAGSDQLVAVEAAVEIVSDDEDDKPGGNPVLPLPAPPHDGGSGAARSPANDPAQLALLPSKVLAVKLCRTQLELSKRNIRIRFLENKVRNVSRQLATAKSKSQKSLSLLKEAREQHNCFELTKLGKQKEGRAGRWSLQSRFSMGIRSCLCTIAAADFSVVSMHDISKQTVLRAQCLTGAAVVSLFRSFCAEGLAIFLKENDADLEVQLQTDACNFNLFGVGYRSDATNTNIWHRKKLHVCEATVTYLTDVKKLQEGSFDAAMSSRSCVLFGCSFMGCTRGHPQNYEVTKVT